MQFLYKFRFCCQFSFFKCFFTFDFAFVISFSYGQEKSEAKKFLEQFEPLEGQYFEGEIVAGGKEGDGFAGQKLMIQVKSYSDREVKIPFYVDEDKSRTWVLTYSNHTLTLKHDHRHADGSPDNLTFYGVYYGYL